jgi:hypothetical protein
MELWTDMRTVELHRVAQRGLGLAAEGDVIVQVK